MEKIKKAGITCICLSLLTAFSVQPSAEAAGYKFNMSYIYFGSVSDYTRLVDNTQNSLDEVAPNYFALKSDGSLVLTSAVSTAFVEDMHRRGIDVVPYLSNDWSRSVGRAALKSREKLAESLAEAVETYGLDGVNIDIENLTAADRADYVDFVRLLRSLLPAGKKLAVAVAANPWGLDTGWQGSYDYAGLAEYCDYLMIMAYDEHYSGGPAGPVSSLSFVEKSIQYALGLVPGDKIVVGLPFYGRIWSDSGGHPEGHGVSNAAIAQYINRYGGTVWLDPVSKSACARITIRPGDKKPVIGGRTLAEGSYTIWFENEQSIKAKLSLISKYNLKGTGSWCLGQETPRTWDYYKLWLNNCTFADIETSWAKDYILEAYLKGYVCGYSPDRFSPEAPLTRAQAAVVLVRKLGLVPSCDTAYSFDDCIGSWAQPFIETARRHGIVDGVGGNRYDPNRPVTREEIAVMVKNAISLQTTGSAGRFKDVSPVSNPWSYGAITALASGGVLSGYPDGTYQPSAPLTRAQMAVLLYKMPAAQVFVGDVPLYVQV
jgi:spore germination protein YaaH